MQHDLILFHKPFGVLCQFTGAPPTLADHIDLQGFYPAGRLDKDSEGLLILNQFRRVTSAHHRTHSENGKNLLGAGGGRVPEPRRFKPCKTA